jgi:hypothetical protein
MTKPSWVPKKHGPIYCSPACGGGCTMAAYKQAKDNAMRLAKRLGKGWKSWVWENLGWHYAAACGESRVHLSMYGGFWASVYAGRQFTAMAATPQAALKMAILACDKFLAKAQRERAAIGRVGL